MPLLPGQITSSDISPNAGILGTQIADATIQTRNIAPNTILSTFIVNETITNVQIAPNTVTGGPTGNLALRTLTTDNIVAGTIRGTDIYANTITGNNIDTLDLTSKTITADTGTIGGWELGETSLTGPVGAIISSGQTDFNVGTGFWLGNASGVPKFSIGSASGNQMSWDGTNLRVTGSFTPTSVFNTYTYTVATLPQPPTTVGFNPPSAYE